MELGIIVSVIIGLAAIAIIGFLGWYLYMKARFVTVPSNEALIITGPKLGPADDPSIFTDDNGRSVKIQRGGGVRKRMFQNVERVSLKSFQLNIRTSKVNTVNGVAIIGEAVANVKIADEIKDIVKYAEQYLGKPQTDIEKEIENTLNATFRSVLASMTVEQINESREEFSRKVSEVAQKQLNEMGFYITSFSLNNILDEDGYLNNLGRKQVALIEQQAETAESESNRLTKVQQAQDNEATQNEEIKQQTKIDNATKERALNAARNLKETNEAEAEAEAAKERRRAELQIDIDKERIKVTRQDREATLELDTLNRQNQLNLQKQQVEIEKQQADAEYYAVKRSAEADAESIELKAKAEANALKVRADIMAKHGNMIIMEQMIAMMPEIARVVSEPLSNVESIRIMDSGSGDQINSLPAASVGNIAQTQEIMKQMTNLNFEDMIKAQTGVSSVFNRQNNNNQDEDAEPQSSDHIGPSEFDPTKHKLTDLTNFVPDNK